MFIHYCLFKFCFDIIKLYSWNLEHITFPQLKPSWEESDTVRNTDIPKWLELGMRILWKITHLSAIQTLVEFVTQEACSNWYFFSKCLKLVKKIAAQPTKNLKLKSLFWHTFTVPMLIRDCFLLCWTQKVHIDWMRQMSKSEENTCCWLF